MTGAALRLEGGSVTLDLDSGDRLALIGPNGAGKTRLLRSIAGLTRTDGQLWLDGRDLTAQPAHLRARAGIGFCAADRRVFPGMSVRDNLLTALPPGARDTAPRLEAALALFPQLRVKARAAAWTLSGGQRQMLVLARALMMGPRLLLLDEPLTGLAPALATPLMDALTSSRTAGVTMIIAEPVPGAAARLCGRALVMAGGRVRAEGSVAEVSTRPDLADLLLGLAEDR